MLNISHRYKVNGGAKCYQRIEVKQMIELYQGDCLEVLKTLPDNSVDLLLTDPPYVLNTKGGGTVNKKMKLSESLADVEKAKIINGYDIELFWTRFFASYERNQCLFLVQ